MSYWKQLPGASVKYAIDADNRLILYIEDWNESFIVPNEDMNVIAETLSSSSVVVLEDQGFFFFRDFSQSPKPIKVIRFIKGNPQVSVDDLSFRTSESYSYKYCNFIDDRTGYLFLFSGASGSYFELSDLLKTTNGGETWYPQELGKVPSIYWKSDLLCAKMLDETVGFCSGQHYADDNMSARTYITADGGKTWEQVVLPKDGPYVDCPDSTETITYMACIEAYDLLYEDGQYVLCFKTRSADADTYFQYASTDLITWTFVE